MVEDDGTDVATSCDAAVPISVAARRVGLSVDTLRIWERRYGLGPSRTSAGGHRRYEEGDLRRLRAAVHLLRSGVPAGEAVRTVLAATLPGAVGAVDVVLRLPPTPAGRAPAGRRRARSGRPGRAPGARCRSWPPTASSRPGRGCSARCWPRSASSGSASRTPSPSNIWCRTSPPRRSPYTPVHRPSGPAQRTRPILLACVPHEEHELPLTALAAALGEQGVAATLLGARTRPGALRTAAAWTAAEPGPRRARRPGDRRRPARRARRPRRTDVAARPPGLGSADRGRTGLARPGRPPGPCRAPTASPTRCVSSSTDLTRARIFAPRAPLLSERG